jgi:hypothetical protein
MQKKGQRLRGEMVAGRCEALWGCGSQLWQSLLRAAFRRWRLQVYISISGVTASIGSALTAGYFEKRKVTKRFLPHHSAPRLGSVWRPSVRPRHQAGALRLSGQNTATVKSHYPKRKDSLILLAVHKHSGRIRQLNVKACEVVSGRRSGIPQQPRSGAFVHGFVD